MLPILPTFGASGKPGAIQNYPPPSGSNAPTPSGQQSPTTFKGGALSPTPSASEGLTPGAEWARGSAARAASLQRKPDAMDSADPYHALMSKYGNVPVATSSKAVSDYAQKGKQAAQDFNGSSADFAKSFGPGNSMTAGQPANGNGGPPSAAAYQQFAKGDHPILSAGDSLLADSARATPGSLYEYKDKQDGPGQYVGPMAQDMAQDPLASTTVVKQPNGTLGVDTSRLSTLNTAQNHAQQNQLDALDQKINSLQSMLQGSSTYAAPQPTNTDDLDDVRKKYGYTGYQSAAGY